MGDQLFGKGGKMTPLGRTDRNGPNVALVARGGLRDGVVAIFGAIGAILNAAMMDAMRTIVADCGLADGIHVEIIARTLGEQEDILVALGATVDDRFGHRVGLLPNDVLTKIETHVAESEGKHPRDTQQILVLSRLAIKPMQGRTSRLMTRVGIGCLVVGTAGIALVAVVGVAHIDPTGAFGLEDTQHLRKDGTKMSDVFLGTILQSYLTRDAIVAQGEVRRTGDAAVDAIIWDAMEERQAIAVVDGVDGHCKLELYTIENTCWDWLRYP